MVSSQTDSVVESASVEFSIRSPRCAARSGASVSTGPPRITLTTPARVGSWMTSATVNNVELHQQIGKS